MSAKTTHSSSTSLVSKVIVKIVSLLSLIASWAVLSAYILLMTDTLLNPWDAAPASALPPAGTLSRTMHDFFTNAPGLLLPAFVVLVTSVGLFLKQVRSGRKPLSLVPRFATTNIAFVCISWLAFPFVTKLEYRVLQVMGVPRDYGFYRHSISLLVALLLLLILLGLQAGLIIESSRARVDKQ